MTFKGAIVTLATLAVLQTIHSCSV